MDRTYGKGGREMGRGPFQVSANVRMTSTTHCSTVTRHMETTGNEAQGRYPEMYAKTLAVGAPRGRAARPVAGRGGLGQHASEDHHPALRGPDREGAAEGSDRRPRPGGAGARPEGRAAPAHWSDGHGRRACARR